MPDIDWYSEFPLRLLTRGHIKALGFTEEHVALLTDDDMYEIGNLVEQACIRSHTAPLWTFMRESVRKVIREKEHYE